jgi:hypothetical protein
LVHLIGDRLARQSVRFGNDGKRGERRHDGVPVGLGARDVGVSDPAAGAALVLDDDVLAECVGEVRGERAGREVGGSARRKRHHDGDGACRPRGLRTGALRGERQFSRGKGEGQRPLQEFPAIGHARSFCMLGGALDWRVGEPAIVIQSSQRYGAPPGSWLPGGLLTQQRS